MPMMELSGWLWVTTYNGIVMLTVMAFPLAVLTVLVLARSRGWRRATAEVGMVYGTVPWVWMTLLPGSGAGEVTGRVRLVPLVDVVEQVGDRAWGQIVGNLLVFAALGFFAPLRFAALASVRRTVALAAACSVTIELVQFAMRLDRVSSVDDVLVNAAGAGLAALASRRWWREPGGPDRPPRTTRADRGGYSQRR